MRAAIDLALRETDRRRVAAALWGGGGAGGANTAGVTPRGRAWVANTITLSVLLVAAAWLTVSMLRLAAMAVAAGRRGRQRRDGLRCAECGYDLRASVLSERCPECGALLE